MKIKNQAYYNRRMKTQLGIIKDMGHDLSKSSTVLDLGCGNGNLIDAYRENGYQCYGCDFEFKEGPYVTKMQNEGIIRKIDTSNYKLPFDDNSFDFVISDQVFEHVKDYPSTLSEIHRVLKPKGVSLHFFPSRYVVIEPHVHVPFASVIQKRYWLSLWANMGVKTPGQKGLSAKEIAERNYNYLTNQTAYLTKAEIKKHCDAYFENVRFCEDYFFKYVQRAPYLYGLSKIAFFLPLIYSTLKTRVLFFSK